MRMLSNLLLALFAVSLHAQQVVPLQRSQLPKRTPPPNAAQNVGLRPQAKPAVVGVLSFKELDPTTGWASTGKSLIWTKDNGQHWKDITPPNPHYNRLDEDARLVDVLFADVRTGWVLLCYHPSSGADDWAFDISATQDGGQTWTNSPVVAPDLATERLGGTGHLTFSDAMHGWTNLDVQSSSAFNLGALLATSDGGRTWTFVEGDPALGGPVVREASGNGWILHNSGEDLEASLDTGRSFHEVEIQPPAGVAIQADPSRTLYGLPSLLDSQNGVEPVLFRTSDGANSELVLFTTQDGGKTWKSDRKVTNLGLASLNTVLNTSYVGSTWVVPVASPGVVPTILPVSSGTAPQYPTTSPDHGSISSFISAQQGWIYVNSGLLATTDGGNTWQNISPTFTIGSGVGSNYTGVPQTELNASPLLSTGNTVSFRAASSSRATLASQDDPPPVPSGVAQNLGFDAYSIPTTAQMLDWWSNSPYYILGFYLNGSESHRSQSGLTSSYINTITGDGWGVFPIWSGLQAPCACRGGHGTYPSCTLFPNTFSNTPATAQTQGAADADSAYYSALSINLDAGIIYLDIEQFSSATCGAAAQAYLTGFVNEMAVDSGAGSGGVYGSVTNATSDFAAASSPPSNAFLAWSNKRFSVWNLNPTHGPGVADTLWPSHQRASQFWEQISQTWGSTTLSIDTDIFDGLVYPPSQPKIFSFAETDVQYPSVDSFGFEGMNNSKFFGPTTNTAVGMATVYEPNYEAYGTLYNNSAFSATTLVYPGDPGVYYTEPWAINNKGVVVGWYFTTTDNTVHGFEYNVATNAYTNIDVPGAVYNNPSGINDAGWVVGTVGFSDGSSECYILKGTLFSYWTPTGSYPNCWGINGTGEVIGYDGDENVSNYGYLYDAQGGNPSSGSVQTLYRSIGNNKINLTGINNNGLVTGYDYVPSDSLLYDSVYQTWTSLLTGTGAQAFGINDNGQITGEVQPASIPPYGQGFVLGP